MENLLVGVALFVISSFVGLAVWAINAKIKASEYRAEAQQRESELKRQNEMLQLEVKIARDYIAPAIEELRALVRHLEEQMHLRDEMREGFAAMLKRESSLVRPSTPHP